MKIEELYHLMINQEQKDHSSAAALKQIGKIEQRISALGIAGPDADELMTLINELGAEYEKQGFELGFACSTDLLTQARGIGV